MLLNYIELYFEKKIKFYKTVFEIDGWHIYLRLLNFKNNKLYLT